MLIVPAFFYLAPINDLMLYSKRHHFEEEVEMDFTKLLYIIAIMFAISLLATLAAFARESCDADTKCPDEKIDCQLCEGSIQCACGGAQKEEPTDLSTKRLRE